MPPSARFRPIRSPSSPRSAPLALVLLTTLALAGCSKDRQSDTAPLSPVQTHERNLSAGLDGSDDMALATTLGGPIAGLTPEELARFEEGLEEFQELETAEDGLGPVFNEAACVTCHDAPVGGTNGRLETRFGRWTSGQFLALDALGGSLIQDQAIGTVSNDEGTYTYVAEVVPKSANRTASRLTTPLFGLGLVDAIPDEVLIALASSQDFRIRGRVHMVKEIRTGAMRVGRFGWKAQVPTLFQFSGDAYLNEMGVTSPQFPDEIAPQGNQEALKYNPVPELNDEGEGVDGFADFMTFLGPPPRGATNAVTQAGEKVFQNIGCAGCHTMTHRTGFNTVQALSNKTFHPFSDFLLHDMGNLGDGIAQGDARPREIRTAPLWGLMSRPTFLHDGRAKTPEAAILAHDGQGGTARGKFQMLTAPQREALMAFLKSL